MKRRMSARPYVMLLILFGLQGYVGWHLKLYLGEWLGFGGNVYAALYWPIYAVGAFGYLIARLLRRRLPVWVGLGLKRVGSYWLAVFEYAVLLLPFADLAAWLLRSQSVPPADAIMSVGTSVIVILLVIMLRGSWNAWSPIVRKHEVELSKTAGEWKELHIAVASDLHLGTTVGKRHLARLVRRVNELQPDLVLLPGDVLDDDVEPFIRRQYGHQLAQMQATLGVYAVLGNHEYYGGGIETYVPAMSELQMPVLLDEALLLGDSFYLIGRKDKTDRSRASVAELTAGLDSGKPWILMDHQPSALREIADSGVDLSLSGHTHRGQMAPNHWITRRIFELDWGYKQIGRLHAFVSSGFGTWGPPIRIGSRSEILSITVRFGCH
ncbi:metallophosphoesterase [Paenibacillus sacheonensis]|uniref:Metallophosphoesterase n=1 Tax=Paenibacillus sacheonensis TaxID=742054 RepID=A0A7X4YLW7_9BACL|nr:metallophosphoesterase [Paenibacillus sacheonensis]MBM7563852.1 putative MPP superfamily phosphohydrolase [Paenibacillus sacheonensis]NBC67799.1 metallophosphoesterase [Paenibacillus sacheonensis]